MTKKENQPYLLRMRSLTVYLDLSRGYIFQKIKEGTFPSGYMISSGVRAWEKSEVDTWLDAKTGRSE